MDSRFSHASLIAFSVLISCLSAVSSHAFTIDWMAVDDPGNIAETTTYGAVIDSFQIMKYEFTNEQYKDFLNSVAATADPLTCPP